MKKLAAGAAAILLLATTLVFAAPKPKSQTFTGEIMDSQCAMNGSHAEMLKKEGMGDKDPNDPMAKKMCTQNCLKMGGKYVLFNPTDKTVYELDDQKKPEQFAGDNVKVKGTLDGKTIHVRSITKA
jgi:Protein of unknown function (DUF5818)